MTLHLVFFGLVFHILYLSVIVLIPSVFWHLVGWQVGHLACKNSYTNNPNDVSGKNRPVQQKNGSSSSSSSVTYLGSVTSPQFSISFIWVLVHHHVEFKLAMLVFKALHSLALQYLADDCRQLRLSNILACIIHCTRTHLGSDHFQSLDHLFLNWVRCLVMLAFSKPYRFSSILTYFVHLLHCCFCNPAGLGECCRS